MTRRAWTLFTTISMLWGLPYLLIKVSITELDPSVIVFARVLMSAIVLLPVALIRGALPLMLVRARRIFRRGGAARAGPPRRRARSCPAHRSRSAS